MANRNDENASAGRPGSLRNHIIHNIAAVFETKVPSFPHTRRTKNFPSAFYSFHSNSFGVVGGRTQSQCTDISDKALH